jgi:NAD(P)-dependent dehydrogenase (short-subunit alcohol dehydrogenase family)
MGQLAGRIALITGASRGLGAAIAERFAAEGAHVICLARTVGGLEETDDRVKAAGGRATLIPADLTKADTAPKLAAAIIERFKKLDIFIGNAAVLGVLSPIGMGEPKHWPSTFATNVFANQALLAALDPLLRGSEAGRAIFVTCRQGSAVTPFWNAYAASKAALEMMARSYAAETAKSPLKVNLVDPGPLRTRLRAQAFPGEDPAKVPSPESAAGLFLEPASADYAATGQLIAAGARERG